MPSAKLLTTFTLACPLPKEPLADPLPKFAKQAQLALSRNTLFFSPDGNRLATMCDPPITLGVWNTETGRLSASLQLPADTHILSGAFSPEGRTIALGMADGTAALYEVASGQRRLKFGGQPPVAKKADEGKAKFPGGLVEIAITEGSSVAFSPYGKLVAHAGLDNVVRLWDLAGKSVAEFRGHTSRVLSLAFSPDGRKLASGSADTTVLLWDVSRLPPAP